MRQALAEMSFNKIDWSLRGTNRESSTIVVAVVERQYKMKAYQALVWGDDKNQNQRILAEEVAEEVVKLYYQCYLTDSEYDFLIWEWEYLDKGFLNIIGLDGYRAMCQMIEVLHKPSSDGWIRITDLDLERYDTIKQLVDQYVPEFLQGLFYDVAEENKMNLLEELSIDSNIELIESLVEEWDRGLSAKAQWKLISNRLVSRKMN